jgi:hypothetical protein
MTEEQTKPKRPEFVNGVRVRMPEDYDFNSWGNLYYLFRKRLFFISKRF